MMNNTPSMLGFYSRIEHFIGDKLSLIYAQAKPIYLHWLSRAPNKISAFEGREKLQTYMPELLPTYDALCHAFGSEELTGAFLSLYNPPTFRTGCSQACKNEGEIELVRNYDFPAQMCDRLLLHSNWNGTRVIAMTDCLWGVLDGMNEHGLALSLAYGGRSKRGDGFAITLVLRYILEFCRTTNEAVAVLKRIPVHMPYNVTVVDCSGLIKTVAICPDELAQEITLAFATNHQQGGSIENVDNIADSYMREQYLSTRLADPRQAKKPLVDLFLAPPLLRRATDWYGWGTLYTARYKPLAGVVELHWPNGEKLTQSFQHFIEGDKYVHSPAFL